MMAALALWVFTIALFVLPLLPALRELRLKRDVLPLGIVREHDRNAFAFANTYRILVAEAMQRETISGGLGARSGSVVVGDGGRPLKLEFVRAALALNPAEEESRSTLRAWAALDAIRLPDGFAFKREVYGALAVMGGAGSTFRAVMSETDLRLGPRTAVLRWAHGKNVLVSPGARLTGQVSADDTLSLGTDCAFSRLHAPIIEIGEPGPPKNVADEHPVQVVGIDTLSNPVFHDPSASRTVIEGDLEIPENGVFHGDLVAYGEIRLGRQARVVGSIKSRSDIFIGERVIIEGAAISAKHLSVGLGSEVFGPLVAEGDICIAGNCRIGRRSNETSVTAPRITLQTGTIVFGTLWAREQGVVTNDGWGPA